MRIFYFTSTGNSLAVAKRVCGVLGGSSEGASSSMSDGTLVSIPQVVDGGVSEYTDDVIGLVFPIYGFFIPKMVRRFLAETKLAADYIFAIGTYGNLPGACLRNTQRFAAQHGNRIDYLASLLMVDNYLSGFDMADQIAKLPAKQVEENLARIITELHARKRQTAQASLLWRLTTASIGAGEKLAKGDVQAKNYIVNGDCTTCGICAKVCPAGNITVSDQVTFGERCEWCLGCVHLCPQNAIHLKTEKSAQRWRNPETTLAEIIAANNRTPGRQG